MPLDIRSIAVNVDSEVAELQTIRQEVEDGKHPKMTKKQSKQLDKLCLDLGCVKDDLFDLAQEIDE